MIEELYKAFDAANKELWEDGLPRPMIIVSRKSKKHELGYITVNKVWKPVEEDEEGTNQAEYRYEINISAEALERPIEEIVGILIHEMVHLFNNVHEIKDMSMGQVHNKNFKKEAERVGLEVSKGPGVGFGVTVPTLELMDKIQGWKIDQSVFSYVRIGDPEKEKAPTKGKFIFKNPENPKEKITSKYRVKVISDNNTGVVWTREWQEGEDGEPEPGLEKEEPHNEN